MTDTRTARPRPCRSCPYRRDCPAGIWAAEEYARLIDYDGSITDQAYAGACGAFGCHQGDGALCAGWLGHRDPADLLAVRLGLQHDSIDPTMIHYTTDVPLFASGAEAAAHGLAGIADPGPDARAAAAKIIRVRAARGEEVTFG